MNNLKDTLVEIGLSDKEAAVYLAACQLGPSSAQDISDSSGVKRATVYVCLEALQEKGFMSTSTVFDKTLFVAEKPDRLLSASRDEMSLAQKRLEQLDEAMPQLAALYNVEGRKPQVMFMDGVAGLRRHLAVMESLSGPYIQITNIDDAKTAFSGSEFTRESHQENLRKSNVNGRALLVTKEPFSQVKLARLPVDVKLLHYEEFPIHGEITVREDTILMLSFKLETFVTIIRSKTVANVVRSLFELAWKGASEMPGFTAEERMKWHVDDSGRFE
jgi:DNA-binding MarR family transcriptional regulator